MKKDTEILREEFDKLKQELIDKHIQLGMKASGRWIDSVENRTSGLSGQLWANDYTEQLVDGRKPGKFPPIHLIEQWIIDKGITITDDMKVSTLAFLIARKISKEGTEYFKQGGTDLLESVITPKRIQNIIDKMGNFYVENFTSDIKSFLEKMQQE